MNQINHLLKTFHIYGSLVTHEDTDRRNGVHHIKCSTFIKKRQLLAKGECGNPKSEERNAMIVLFDPKTGRFKGEFEFLFVFKFSSMLI